MEILSNVKQYLLPTVVSVVAVGLLKIGLFVTVGDLERSLRLLEATIRSEYATKEDIRDIKVMLTRVEMNLSKLDDRLNETRHR